jgi:hypothetical protein
MTEATKTLSHMKIILQRRSYGWAAWFYGGDMPEDVELPLPLTSAASPTMVAADIRRRFPGAEVWYRDGEELVPKDNVIMTIGCCS